MPSSAPSGLRRSLRRGRWFVGASLVLALVAPAPLRAAVLDADYVGGVQVATNQTLRAAAPDLQIPTGVLATIDGTELWARDPDAQHAMASTTKIMTAVVVLENASLEETVAVDRRSAKVGESAVGLVPGEVFTVRDLLKGLLIQSGNDAATLLAEHVGGSVDGFVTMMNEKAAALDLRNTHFANPHGLDAAGHYSSADDLTSLGRYAMRNPVFREFVGISTAKIRSDRYTHLLKSHNALLQAYDGAEGIKTGMTDDAGYCIVVAAKRGEIELVATILGAQSDPGRTQQAKRLLDWGFAHYTAKPVVAAGQSFGFVPVSDYMERAVGVVAAEATQVAYLDLAGDIEQRVELARDVPAPVKAGDRIGSLTVYQGSNVLKQIELVSDRDVPVPSAWQRIVFFFGKLWRGIFGT